MYVVFVLYLFVILVVSHVGFGGWGGSVILIAPVPSHYLPFIFFKKRCKNNGYIHVYSREAGAYNSRGRFLYKCISFDRAIK